MQLDVNNVTRIGRRSKRLGAMQRVALTGVYVARRTRTPVELQQSRLTSAFGKHLRERHCLAESNQALSGAKTVVSKLASIDYERLSTGVDGVKIDFDNAQHVHRVVNEVDAMLSQSTQKRWAGGCR